MINKILIFYLLSFLISFSVLGQTHAQMHKVYLYADKLPEFKGGFNKLQAFLKQELKWPESGTDVQGMVLLSFIVSVEGSISNIKIEKSLSEAFDNEASRVVRLMPKWVPGKIGNKNVDIKVYFPIDFSIDN